MKRAAVFAVVLNDPDWNQVQGLIRRACAHCARTGQALLLEFPLAGPGADQLSNALGAAMMSDRRPPAISLVVAPKNLAAVREVSVQLAMKGLILGVFTTRDAAVAHAVRERALALSEARRVAVGHAGGALLRLDGL